MGLLIFAAAVIFAISGFAAYFIGLKVYRNLAKAANKNAKVLSAVTGVLSFLIIAAGIFYLILINLDFHR